MTSGNRAEEPILHENELAQEKLSDIADAFLFHNRPIYRRVDDSVYALIEGKPYPIRRARGYAPNPIRLNQNLPQILAVGPQMKNTFCMLRDNYAFISHYIGEMENWETFQDFQKAIKQYEQLFRIRPQAIAYDLHPDYITTKYAKERALTQGLHSYPIQHHHAHLVAGMIENGIPPEQTVAGLIFDGSGYGSDGTIWGGEILIGNSLSFSRAAFLKPVPLPGGDVAIRNPSRMALSTLWAYNLPWQANLPPLQALSAFQQNALKTQLEKQINAPLTSSMGRLFDAVSALIGIRQAISYEAQAAIELETVADPLEKGYYPWHMDEHQIIMKPTLESIIEDHAQGTSSATISGRFHNTIARLSFEQAQAIRETHGIRHFVLSGGVWQNRLLLEKTLSLFNNCDLIPLIHRHAPANDGCVSFGEAIIAAYRYLNEED